jgi:hypothetical protein
LYRPPLARRGAHSTGAWSVLRPGALAAEFKIIFEDAQLRHRDKPAGAPCMAARVSFGVIDTALRAGR